MLSVTLSMFTCSEREKRSIVFFFFGKNLLGTKQSPEHGGGKREENEQKQDVLELFIHFVERGRPPF